MSGKKESRQDSIHKKIDEIENISVENLSAGIRNLSKNSPLADIHPKH